MIEFFRTQSLSDYGSWASIIGLCVTIYAVWALLGIKKKFLFRANINDHMEKITDISSQISSLLISFEDNKVDIEELFALADVELRAMQRGAEGDLLSDIKNSRSLITKYTSILYFWVEKNEDSARRIKKGLSVVSAELTHHRRSLIVGK